MLEIYCFKCHSSHETQADLDLEQFSTLTEVRTKVSAWIKVAEQIATDEMPPANEPQPTPDERQQLREWLERYLRTESLDQAGDPGPVALRRLNNAKYTWTIRDLTGIELDPAREFPADSAAGEGFTNAGNALSMSPALLGKYFDAGKEIARHVVLLPDGFRFSPSTTPRDWTEEVLAEIRDFYRQYVHTEELGIGTSVGVMNLHGNCGMGQLGHLPLEQYLTATIAERPALRSGERSIADVAAARRLNAKYLEILWLSLNANEPSILLDELRQKWRDATVDDVPNLAKSISSWQRGLWTFNSISHLGRKGSRSRWLEPESPIVSHHEMRLKFPPIDAKDTTVEPGLVEGDDFIVSFVTTDAGDGNTHDDVIWRKPRLVVENQPDVLIQSIDDLRGIEGNQFGIRVNGEAMDIASLSVKAPGVITVRLPRAVAAGKELVVTAEMDPETGRDGSVQVDLVAGIADPPPGLLPSVNTVTLSSVSALYPDQRTVSFQRPILLAHDSVHRTNWESAMESHRRLFPPSLCYPQVVPTDELLTLTQFYRDDEHLKRLVLDQHAARKIDRLWEELLFVSHEPIKLSDVLDSFVETLRGHSQKGAFDALLEPVERRAELFRQRLIDAEQPQLERLIEFAHRAYRRPLETTEAETLRSLYRQLRTEGLGHDEAFRLTLARIFCASPFLFRIENSTDGSEPMPVSDWELASRLSYFLWSSEPDSSLRQAAAEGRLHEPDVLAEQTVRMLKHPRIRRLATEFGCQWLHVHEFPLTETKSEQLYPEFAELRGDMYEESIAFLTHVFQQDRSLLDVFDSDYTFVNDRLANFYGFQKEIAPGAWERVEGIRAYGRGGVLGLAATLSKQSGASRTSPILRGNWVSEVLLGEKLPRPPKDVPQLSDSVPEGLTERQMIERHSSDVACAKCHRRIDPIGFALEAYDAIGRQRKQNPPGVPIDTQTVLPDGQPIDGLPGLRDYLMNQRRDAMIQQFCRKLLGYALGREVQLSDTPLLEDLQRQLANAEFRVSTAVKSIVLSPQFCQKRSGGQ